jgi:hypothetical protein
MKTLAEADWYPNVIGIIVALGLLALLLLLLGKIWRWLNATYGARITLAIIGGAALLLVLGVQGRYSVTHGAMGDLMVDHWTGSTWHLNRYDTGFHWEPVR